MRVLKCNSLSVASGVWIEEGVLNLPEKVSRLHALERMGLRLPESVLVDARDSRAISSDVAPDESVLTGALALAANVLSAGTRPPPMRVAVRRVLGGSNVCHPVLDVPLELLGTGEVVANIYRWLHWQEAPENRVAAFLIQRMRPSLEEGAGTWGCVSTRDANGRHGLSGFVFNGSRPQPRSAQIAAFDPSALTSDHMALLRTWAKTAEQVSRGPSTIVFGVSDGELYLLGARRMRAPGWVTAQILTDLVVNGSITSKEAVMSIAPEDVAPGTQRVLNPQDLQVLAAGVPGETRRAATGRLSCTRTMGKAAEPTILVRDTVGPRDASAIANSVGLVVARAGAASHMVVLARGLGKAVLTGVGNLKIDEDRGRLVVDGIEMADGEWLTLDEHGGLLYRGVASMDNEGHGGSEGIVGFASLETGQMLVNADRASEIPPDAVGVGLCRSERHLPIDTRLEEFAHGGSVQGAALASMSKQLDSLLRAAAGRVVYYRLLDNGDYASDGIELGLRGIRWGIRSGFYEAQLEMLGDVVRALAADGYAVDMVVVAPFVTLPEEARWLAERVKSRSLRDAGVRVRLRLGCMIETPAGALRSGELAAIADVLCVGTNDLTQQVWGISRDQADVVCAGCTGTGMFKRNPFIDIDMATVGYLIRFVADRAAEVSPYQRVVICGEHASVTQNARLWTELGRPTFSTRPSAVGPMRVAFYQAAQLEKGERVFDHWPESTRETASHDTLQRIGELVRVGDLERARGVAWQWAENVSSRYGLQSATNWKFFKRDLAAFWFGKNESRRFLPGWSVEEVVAYAETLRSASTPTRFSVFPATIACHAVSEVLPANINAEERARRLGGIDRKSAVEVFPDQSSTKLCFRVVLVDGVVRMESGIGQAMYVFEQDRGSHPVLVKQLFPADAATPESSADQLQVTSERFVEEHGGHVVGTMFAVLNDLGCDWLAIEGYYATGEPLVVCDMDLPFDLAFHVAGTA